MVVAQRLDSLAKSGFCETNPIKYLAFNKSYETMVSGNLLAPLAADSGYFRFEHEATCLIAEIDTHLTAACWRIKSEYDTLGQIAKREVLDWMRHLATSYLPG